MLEITYAENGQEQNQKQVCLSLNAMHMFE